MSDNFQNVVRQRGIMLLFVCLYGFIASIRLKDSCNLRPQSASMAPRSMIRAHQKPGAFTLRKAQGFLGLSPGR